MRTTYVHGLQDILTRRNRHAVALGIFDGVHIGHQHLITAMIRKAKDLKVRSMVITFFPHPAHVLVPRLKLGYLVPLAHRLKLLEDLGVQECVVMEFTKDFAQVKPEAFIRGVLAEKYGAKAIFVGEEFRFGKNRAGDVALFKKMASTCGYTMHAVKPVNEGGSPVSSTRLRALIPSGDLPAAEKLLGRPFSVRGKVVKGDGRGAVLGFPTANVEYHADILPPDGVYAVRAQLNSKTFKAVANLGMRPSFAADAPKRLLEVHIFDVHRNLYGQELEIEFIQRIRPERKFASPQDLIEQIQRDVNSARQILDMRFKKKK